MLTSFILDFEAQVIFEKTGMGEDGMPLNSYHTKKPQLEVEYQKR